MALRPDKDFILDLMKELGWSQVKLAEELNVNPTTLNRWFRGKRNASWDLADAISKRFRHISLDDLMLRDDEE